MWAGPALARCARPGARIVRSACGRDPPIYKKINFPGCLNLATLLLYNPTLMKGIKMKIRSKHNNLLNYFICNREDLSKEYERKSEKFLKEISDKLKKEKEESKNGIY